VDKTLWLTFFWATLYIQLLVELLHMTRLCDHLVCVKEPVDMVTFLVVAQEHIDHCCIALQHIS